MSTDRSPSAPPRRGRHWWALIGQASVSLGSLVFTIAIAGAVSATEFGVWSLGWGAIVIALALARGVASQVLMLSSPGEPVARKDDAAGSVAMSLGIGVGCALALACSAPVTGDGRALVALGPASVGMVVTQATRYALLRNGRAAMSATIDIGQLLLAGSLVAALLAIGSASVGTLSLAWGASTIAAAFAGVAVLRLAPGWHAGIAYFRRHRSSIRSVGREGVVNAIGGNTLPFIIALVLGVNAAGAMRGALALMGGIAVVLLGLTPLLTVRAASDFVAGRSLSALLWRWDLVVAGSGACYAVAVLAIPDALGRQLLGETWPAAAPLLLALSIQSMLRGPTAGAVPILQGGDQLRAALGVRYVSVATNLTFPAAGGWVFGLQGAAWGMVAAALLAGIYGHLIVSRATNRAIVS